jgi:integrase
MDLGACEEVQTEPREPNEQVFTVRPDSLENAEIQQATGTSGRVFYKVVPGLVTPGNLPIECFPEYEKLLERRPELVEEVNIMMRGAVAVSTAKQYATAIIKFLDFCKQQRHAFPDFTAGAVLEYVAECKHHGAPLGRFRQIVPALQLLEQVAGRVGTGLTTQVRGAVVSIQRELAAKKPAVRKAVGYDFSVIDKLMAAEILPHLPQLHTINAFSFRSLFRAVIIYFTFCRFGDFTKLTDKEFDDKGDHIRITFLTRKNDQMGDNSVHVIPTRRDCSICPVHLVRCYFQRFGLTFQGSGLPVNFRLRKDGGRYVRAPGVLSRSNATKYTRQLLAKNNFDGEHFTEKSLKVGGVTNLLNAGEPLENVQLLGGWRSLQTPLYYRAASTQLKQTVAARIPLSSAAGAPSAAYPEPTATAGASGNRFARFARPSRGGHTS